VGLSGLGELAVQLLSTALAVAVHRLMVSPQTMGRGMQGTQAAQVALSRRGSYCLMPVVLAVLVEGQPQVVQVVELDSPAHFYWLAQAAQVMVARVGLLA
jgi:hypothetical protein